MGGRLEIASEIGQGTRVDCYLDLAEEEDDLPSPGSTDLSSTDGKLALLDLAGDGAVPVCDFLTVHAAAAWRLTTDCRSYW